MGFPTAPGARLANTTCGFCYQKGGGKRWWWNFEPGAFPAPAGSNQRFVALRRLTVLAGIVALGTFRALTRRFMRTGQNVRSYPQVSDLVWFCYIAERRNAPPHKRWTVSAT